MFRLNSAPFRTLEAQFITDLLALRQANPLASLLVVIPTGRLRTHLQHQLLKTQPALLNIHFLTFFGLAEEILADGPTREDRVVGEAALYREMIRGMLEGTADVPFQLREEFLGAGKTITRGLPGALAGTLKDLRDAGVRVTDALKAALEGHLGPEAASAAPTLELYAHVYGLLQKLQLRTPSDLLRRAAEHAPQSAFLKRQQAVMVYGFYDLTGVQLDLLLALANHPQANLYIPYEDGNPTYAYVEKLLHDPALVGKTAKVGPPPAPAGDDKRGGGGPIPPLTFTSASGARDEIWFVAKEIQRLLDDGVKPAEIAVIARTLNPYFAALRDVFVNHQIPYVTSKNESAGAHPWLKALRAQVRQNLDTVTAAWGEHCAWARMFVIDGGALQDPVLESLTQLSLLDVLGNVVTREHFVDAWEDKLDALEMPGPAVPFAGVQVLEVQQARGLRFKAVFLIGLNEKIFPRLIREDPFLSDTARSSLAQALGARLGRKLDGYQEERFLFELMLQTAEQYLYLVWQRSDEEGKAVIPSVYVQELLRTRKAKPARLPRSLADKLKDRPAAALTPKELSFLINRVGAVPDALYAALGWDVARYNALLRAHRALESFRPGILALDGLVQDSPQLAEQLTRGYSPSGLERLADCPYQFFAGHVLGLPEPDDLAPAGQIAVNTLGTVFHQVLELYYKGTPLSPACEQAFSELQKTYPKLYPLIVKSSKQTIFECLSEFIKSDLEELKSSGFQPTHMEKSLTGALPELGPALAHVPFRGRIDRIDLKTEAGRWIARVVDYKSGKARDVPKEIAAPLIKGKFLQLPLYMGLAQAFLRTTQGGTGEVRSSTLRWLRLEDQGKKTPTLEAPFWKEPAADLFRENLKGLIEIAENGHFYIDPDTSDHGHCSRCNFARICRKEHIPTRTRAEEDPVHKANATRLERKVADSAAEPGTRKKRKRP